MTKLSELNEQDLNDELIGKIVFDHIYDDGESSMIGIVFGHYQVQKYRVEEAINLYHQKRIKKILFSGGIGGFANHSNEMIPEANLMKEQALKGGVREEDIIIEDKSNSTIENVLYSIEILKNNGMYDVLDRITLITSDFHLKRCYAIFKKYYGKKIDYTLVRAQDGYSDRENWLLSEYKQDSGRFYVTWEAKILIRDSKEGKIFDLDY